jgi:hypothetical protein
LKLHLLFLLFLSISCNDRETAFVKGQNKIESKSKNNQNTEMFKSKVIIILSKNPIGDSYLINIQDYVENGLAYIPVFSTKEKFTKSTKGVDIGKQIIEIDGLFLLSLLNGNETLRINPRLEDEEYYKASELISKYKTEIDSLKVKMARFPK